MENNSKRNRQIVLLALGAVLVAGVAHLVFAAGGEAPELRQNYPNPFSTTTEIRYSIPTAGHVLMRVFNALGQEVATIVNEKKPSGEYPARFDGSSFPNGQYTYVLEFTSDEDGAKSKLTKRMYLVR